MTTGPTGRFGGSTGLNHLPGKHDQSSHGGGGGVRGALAGAGTIGELNAAAAAEAKRITGRDIPFDMAGSDLDMGKEHVEGVLRGLERFPDARLVGVRTYGPGHDIFRSQPDAFAVTQKHGVMQDGKFVMQSNIYFRVSRAGDPTTTRSMLREGAESGHLVSGTPMGTAMHEFGHVLTNDGGTARTVYDHAVEQADAIGASPRHHIARQVSSYASTAIAEFSAEVTADVLENGDAASELSKSSFAVLEREYRS